MATCYHCGCSIRPNEGYRRKVQTGESTRVYSSRNPGSSYGQSFGLRTLCQDCAIAIDQQHAIANQKGKIAGISAAVGLITAGITFLNIRSFIDNDTPRLIFAFFILGGPGFCLYFLLLLFRNSNQGENSSSQSYASVQPESMASQISNVDLNLYIAKIRTVGEKVEALGISFFGVYGLERKQENMQRLGDIIFSILPPRHHGDIDVWEDHLLKTTYNRFLNEFSVATNPINFEVLLSIFPGESDESEYSYQSRLNAVVREIMPIIHPEIDVESEGQS